MKKQIVMVHGGHTVGEYCNFLTYIKSKKIDNPFGEPYKRWSDGLGQSLGDDYEVCAPEMPNKQNAQYEEWKIWFERHFIFLHDGVVLVGWSLGGIFLAKYLSENTVPFRVEALCMIAAPAIFSDFDGGKENTFSFDMKLLKNLEKQVGNIHVFHSIDDFVVPFAHSGMYVVALPNATLHTFNGRNHFLQEELPELIEVIKGL